MTPVEWLEEQADERDRACEWGVSDALAQNAASIACLKNDHEEVCPCERRPWTVISDSIFRTIHANSPITSE